MKAYPELAMTKAQRVALRLRGVTFGWNVDADPVHVEHAKLERPPAEREWRRYCPVCEEGVLLLRRHQETLELQPHDNCFLCGQQIVYKDIKQMRMLDRGNE